MYKRGNSMKSPTKIKLVLVGIVVLIGIAIYFTFFFSYKCSDLGCFKSHQEECAKTKFVKDSEDATWGYHIKGKKSGSCEIEVEMIQVKQGSLDLNVLEGKTMDCLLPLGNIAEPETDLSKCTGQLKEEMQTLIINRLHAHILDNLGQIDEELEKTI